VIADPDVAQLLDAVRDDLAERVAPAVDDPIARRALDMAILVLGSAAVRSRNEVAWMLEEAEAIEALARELGEEPPAAAACGGLHDRYARASELLARTTEAAYAARDAAAIEAVMDLFEQRRRHQDAITGGFAAVGRG
jgi:hypothetical protein